MKTHRTDGNATKIELGLSRVGLDEKERATYLALFELGPSPVRAIAQNSGINRGTTYEVLKKLIDLGLVSYFQKTRHQYFVAEDPSKLAALLELRAEELTQTKQAIAEIIPLLSATSAGAARAPRVRFLEGAAGIRTILEDVLDTMKRDRTHEYRVYSSADVREHLYASFSDYSQKRAKAGIKVRTISIGAGGKLWGLDERRWLEAAHHAPTYQIIYAGKLALISLDDQERPVGAIIEDPHTAETQRIIFDQLWPMLKIR